MTERDSVEKMLAAYRAAVYDWALRTAGDGSWRIVHEHTSAPADFETSKGMLQRRASDT